MAASTKFSEICIIYNPNSTGPGKDMATELRRQLRQTLPDTPTRLLATKYAGHARELACGAAKNNQRPLIVSASGDGGYNEVINGVMDSHNDKAICAVLPAGNANDHSRTMQKRPLHQSIVKGKINRLDLIKITFISSGRKQTRYAHSYAGLGLTPVVAVELNRHTLNALSELVLALKTFFKYRPIKIRRGRRTLRFDSLIFANINQMAKLLTLSPGNRPDDGKLEVVAFPAGKKRRLIKMLARAAATNLTSPRRVRKYVFTTIKKMPMQLDGEVIIVEPGSRVIVQAAPKQLITIV